jgi:hypothetical protein
VLAQRHLIPSSPGRATCLALAQPRPPHSVPLNCLRGCPLACRGPTRYPVAQTSASPCDITPADLSTIRQSTSQLRLFTPPSPRPPLFPLHACLPARLLASPYSGLLLYGCPISLRTTPSPSPSPSPRFSDFLADEGKISPAREHQGTFILRRQRLIHRLWAGLSTDSRRGLA